MESPVATGSLILWSLVSIRILITFSSPFITTIYFLRASEVDFGAFGWSTTGFRSEDVLGYEFGQEVLKPLTNAMILWGIGEPDHMLRDTMAWFS